MSDKHQKALAKLRQQQKVQSRRENALRNLVAGQGKPIEDKIASMRAVQHTDSRRVISAITSMMKSDK
ncbi:hypothetical protein N9E91_07210 [Alphaproteobacteria bacterium]|jgi:hypothetical protein|nr:hypothetical protein [Alphaproteobacteria bacterium]NCF49386.1 hypothetical protein [Bacteroidota bacterium]